MECTNRKIGSLAAVARFDMSPPSQICTYKQDINMIILGKGGEEEDRERDMDRHLLRGE